jgi:uncharacterized protein YjbI with pentapeptide repeats
MADPEQLSILRRGAKVWNRWRAEHSELSVDLTEAYIGDTNLEKANLTRANLARVNRDHWHYFSTRTNLARAKLTEANLFGANLQKADLRNADLTRACLNSASLESANLSGADLMKADLTDAKLSFARLRSSRLGRANLLRATLTSADLVGANLTRADLASSAFNDANLTDVHLAGANLVGAKLAGATLKNANLSDANLSGADLRNADLRNANLFGACLIEADLRDSNLTAANLLEANLCHATLVRANLQRAILTGCTVYGISTWDVNLAGALQENIIITPEGQPMIQVDQLDIAQFIYLLLNNIEIRHVIDTITSKVVLILGRFTKERKPLLEGIRERLRAHGYVPVLFDFDKPNSQTTMETITTLAGMARFVIADLTDAKSILQELRGIVPERPSLPVQPLLLKGQYEPGMIDFFRQFPWFLTIVMYKSPDELLVSLQERIIDPAEAKVKQIRTSAAGRVTTKES